MICGRLGSSSLSKWELILSHSTVNWSRSRFRTKLTSSDTVSPEKLLRKKSFSFMSLKGKGFSITFGTVPWEIYIVTMRVIGKEWTVIPIIMMNPLIASRTLYRFLPFFPLFFLHNGHLNFIRKTMICRLIIVIFVAVLLLSLSSDFSSNSLSKSSFHLFFLSIVNYFHNNSPTSLQNILSSSTTRQY